MLRIKSNYQNISVTLAQEVLTFEICRAKRKHCQLKTLFSIEI